MQSVCTENRLQTVDGKRKAQTPGRQLAWGVEEYPSGRSGVDVQYSTVGEAMCLIVLLQWVQPVHNRWLRWPPRTTLHSTLQYVLHY